MSWTSEHDPATDPPAEGRTLGWTDDAPATNGAEGHRDDDDLGEGPLDPSVFEGLFADLSGPATGAEHDDVDDNPLEAFLATPLTGETSSWSEEPAEPEARSALDAAQDDELPSIDDLFDDDLFGDEQPLAGQEEPSLDEPDVDEVEHPIDDLPADELSIDEFSIDDRPVDDRPVEDPDRTERLLPGLLPVEPMAAEELLAEAPQAAVAPQAEVPLVDEAPTEPLFPEPIAVNGFTGWVDTLPAELDERSAPDHTPVDAPIEPEVEDWDDPEAYDDQFLEYDEDQEYDEDEEHDEDAEYPEYDGDGEYDSHDGYDDYDGSDDHDGYGLHDELGQAALGVVGEVDELDGPRMASPPIQHDPDPIPDLQPVEVLDDGTLVQTQPAPARRRLTAVALAILIGGALGIGGAVALAQTGGDPDDGSETAAAPAGPSVAEQGDSTSTDATDQVPPIGEPGAAEGLQLASLRFVPGAEPPRLAENDASRLLVEALAQAPGTPIAATVRSYSEPTAADDLALSIRQAAALEAHLVELGAQPDQVAVVGVGRSLLSPAQPVPNFVVPSAGLAPSNLSDAIQDIGPFAIGVDGPGGELRAESREALMILAQAMVDDPDQRSVTLAAYSFDRPDREANDAQARHAADTAVAYLAASGIDPTRLTVIVAGDEPYAVTDAVGGHVDLRVGPEAAPDLALGRLAIDQLDFADGSSELDVAGQAMVDALGALLLSSSTVAVIDVHSFDGADLPASVGLSVLRARAIGQRLGEGGVPSVQLRLHAGASPQFRGGDHTSRTVITLVPAAG